MSRLPAALLALTLLVAPLHAQVYPEPASPYVNDFADLLPEEDEAALARQLEGLRDEHDIEMTVVTILRRADYGQSDTIEEFATGLFNAWGVGDSRRNDGVLVLVAREDREMRIALGSGYSSDWDWQARLVIDDYFLPSFQADNYLRGILTGTTQTIEQVVLPHAAGQEPVGQGGYNPLILFGGLFALILGIGMRRQIRDVLTRFRRCPNCGRRGLRASRDILVEPGDHTNGTGQRDLRCPACGHHDRSTYVIAAIKDSPDSGSFGGGSSSGGGASGRW
ncbi:TPM domain-containing protein [Oceaniglobus trochenteri]|uniref:TPM domain-containing protein n=1 Tax=Oceaniglobus trochenteri TaxID=2763260 RepID=UPI001CFFE94C|nr:TPM domain-containing protein [Oceaniglobus trochenteri]